METFGPLGGLPGASTWPSGPPVRRSGGYGRAVSERLVLGRPETHARGGVLSPDERAIRALVMGMNRIDVEVTEELVAGLAAIVTNWPSGERPADAGLAQHGQQRVIR